MGLTWQQWTITILPKVKHPEIVQKPKILKEEIVILWLGSLLFK